MSDQDWNNIIFTNKRTTNKRKNTHNDKLHKMYKIDNETYKQKKLTNEFKVIMQQTRIKLNISHKDLATRLNVKPCVISSYENGLCKTPSNGFITKLEKHLQCKLPRLK